MKNALLKNAHVFFTSLLIFMLHLPFVFANIKPDKLLEVPSIPRTAVIAEIVETVSDYRLIYDQLELNTHGLSREAFDYALKGYNYLKARGKIENGDVITIADFTKASSEKRLFGIDLKNCKTLFNTYVAHGQGSGEAFANRFSNIPESYQSSLGFYVTSDTYIGKNGYSLHLEGLEAGINDKADERAIVMHGAPYVCENYIRARGYIGRSWGCPAVPEKLNKPIIEKIRNGSCLFIYGKNKSYLSHSKILNS
ncbi:murein L,D-transpeptidase catalytic domain family protein [soil metagenome]